MSAYPSALLSVDPGVRGCGCGLFVDGKLVACAYVKSLARAGHGVRESAFAAREVVAWWRKFTVSSSASAWDPEVLVVELAQVYQRGADRTKGDPNVAVLPLVGVVCAVAALLPGAEVREYQPHAWKGTLEKETPEGKNVVEGRVRVRLDAAEIEVFDRGLREAGAMAHNVVDGCAVGMHALGRFERRRVFASE